MVQIGCGFEASPDNQGPTLLVHSGPTLLVDIGLDKSWTPDMSTPPVSGITGVKALVDTGATQSCIDQILAASLGLPVVDRQTISGISGEHKANIYLAQIHVPGLGFTQYGAFAGVDLKAGGQAHEALIGRTFLMHFHLQYIGRTGEVTLTHMPL